MAQISKTIDSADEFTNPFQCEGDFTLSIETNPGAGSNTVRIQRQTSSGGWQNLTNESGVVQGWTTTATIDVYNPTVSTVYRVGIPTADYGSGSVTVAIEGNGIREHAS